jgi:hypothetical protein
MSYNNDIKISTITKSSIKIDPLFVADLTKDGEFNKEETLDTDAQSTGYITPYINLNGYRVSNGMTNFSLDLNGFIPVCTFTFPMGDLLFLTKNYPKDGDIFSLYIRSVGDVYKPIRMDFNILNIFGTSSTSNANGDKQIFTIIGECRIPGLYTQRTKAFRNKTSYDTLLDVSQEIGLGFSSNDPGLSDSMTWICSNFSYYDFISQVTDHSYKDDSSYYDSWVDIFYNLNFVNLSNQFNKDQMEVDKIRGNVKSSEILSGNDGAMPSTELNLIEMDLILSNLDEYAGKPVYIGGYTLISDSGNSSNKTGYVTEIQVFDSDSQDGPGNSGYSKYDIESLTSQAFGDNTILQKGRASETLYKGEKRAIWVGELKTGESSSTHVNYNHAPIQNGMNIEDSSKFTLKLYFNQYLPFIYRGQVIPIEIFIKNSNKAKSNAIGEGSKLEGNTPVLNKFLSGLYVISGFDIEYNKSEGMVHIVSLRKKTWELNTGGRIPNTYPIDTGVGGI